MAPITYSGDGCRVCGAPLWLNGACPSCPRRTLSVNVLGDVASERQRQDAKWGGPEHDDIHYPWEWIDFIAVRTRGLPDPDALRPDEFVIALRQRFVEIAALAVAAIESLDRKSNMDVDGKSLR